MDVKLYEHIQRVLPWLDESQKRKFLASEAISLGRGGIKEISALSGVHRNTIATGIKELTDQNTNMPEEAEDKRRIRAKGAGRKPITITQPGIKEALEKLVDPETYGDPTNPLRWTTKSLRNLQEELQKEGYTVGYDKVGDLLKELGYSLQQNQKMKQVGEESPDRDAQFKHINSTAKQYMSEGNPVISIDCKKKENIGNFKNNGAEYRPLKDPRAVLDHDFPLPELGKAAPYGVYDVRNNNGFVNVGISADTAQFAVNSIRMWWQHMGQEQYPHASALYITADGGGSNGSRCKLFKVELQKLANEINIPIEISHFPPGTSKWNKVEHRLFSQISKNWSGRPLETLEMIVELIASTTTNTGLKVRCIVDKNTYPRGIKVTDEELDGVNITKNEFCGNWNYIISPVVDMHK